MSRPNWAPVFGITESDLADLENHLPDRDQPLQWLLSNGHIEISKYIRWARDQYDLPSLKDSFFDIPADRVYWDAVKYEFKWTSSFFPLAEWQGVMLIGCLQPPDFHFPLRVPHRFVIGSARALELRFRELEAQAAPQGPEVAAVHREEIPPSHAQSAPDLEADHDVDFAPAELVAPRRQHPADEVRADQLPPAPDVDMRDPDGLVFDIDSSPHLSSIVPDGMQVSDLGKPIPTTPDGLSDSSQLIDLSDFSEDPQPVGLSSAPPSVEPPRAPLVPPGPPAAAAKVVMPPAPPAPPAPPVPAVVIRQEPTAFSPRVSSAEPAVPLETCTSVESLMAAAVANTNVHFEHAMVLKFEGSLLKPVKWSELLLSTKGDNPDPILLEQPSIFRIAARTSLPYHGYVVPNQTNTLFFNSFNRGLTPKHCTVMPVMIAGRLTAMLVGISNDSVDFKGSLHAMEKLASSFSAQLERLREKQLAA